MAHKEWHRTNKSQTEHLVDNCRLPSTCTATHTGVYPVYIYWYLSSGRVKLHVLCQQCTDLPVQRLQHPSHTQYDGFRVQGLQSDACFSTAALETCLQDDISMLLLGVDVGIEVRLAGVDGLLDALGRVAALLHVPLQLPGKLDIVTDVQVQLEVQQVPHTLIKEGMKALHHQDLQSRMMVLS